VLEAEKDEVETTEWYSDDGTFSKTGCKWVILGHEPKVEKEEVCLMA